MKWWKERAFYQVYPRSFLDSNGDGIGDLPGLISKLKYIKDSGYGALWVSPFFQSPQKDFGYDISDFFSPAAEYGTQEDIYSLIEEAHRLDLKILFDLVLNHTSDRHPWFIESRSSRDNPKRDWYVWRDGKKPGGRKPPTNWRNRLGGRGWHYDEGTDQWYWAAFLPFQPDLNWRNEEVEQAMFAAMRHWLEAGVDGFRLDILDSIFEDSDFRDNPFSTRLFPSEKEGGLLFQSAEMTVNLPETIAFAKKLRSLVDEYRDPPRFLVGEVNGPIETLRAYCGAEAADGLHAVFLFQTLETPFTATAVRELIGLFERHFADPLLPVWVFSNHDRERSLSRLGGDRQKAKLLAALQLTSRGITFTYQGEEIGMSQLKADHRRCLDPVAAPYRKLPRWVFRCIMKITRGAVCRDGCRSPMQWSDKPNAGFCRQEAEPWLPAGPDYREINLEKQSKKADSLYACYRRFLALRSREADLRETPAELLPASILPRDVLAYRRGNFTVLLNFSNRTRKLEAAPQLNGPIVESTRADRRKAEEYAAANCTTAGAPEAPEPLVLQPWEGLVLKPPR